MQVKTYPPRSKLALWFVAAALIIVAAGSWWMLREEPAQPSAERCAYAPPPAGELPRLWRVPAFRYVDQHGASVDERSLQGQPWIADFIFTQCTSACPMMTSRFVMLQRQLASPLRFVSFSVDPAHDTPEALARYASTWNETESRWLLLATDASRLSDTLSGFRVSAKPSGDPKDPIVHSSVFLLIDAEGWVRGAYESEDAAGRSRLIANARSLANTSDADARSPVSLAGLGCVGCHGNPKVAPELAGLHGSEVLLQNGMKVVADDAYVRRAILDPAAEMVAGYAPLMPSYTTQLSDAEVTALVEEVRALRAPEGTTRGPAEAVALAHDPVCHMTVRATADALHAVHDGHDVYFCSTVCRTAFVADPAKYPLRPQP